MARISAPFVLCLGLFAACSVDGASSAVEHAADAADSRSFTPEVFPDLPGVDHRVPSEPTPYDASANVVVDDLRFIDVEGERFFALGLHASPGLTYDGVTGPGECDKAAGVGYLDINIGKTHAAAAAGANFVYLWGYKDETVEMIDVTPRFKGIFHGGYGQILPVEDDVVPILYNRYGEVDLDGFSAEKVAEMEVEFDHFIHRTGPYAVEDMPALPPVDQVGHMAWHPTWRMIGSESGDGEMLSDAEADALAQALNMMIGDTYTYIENRFDLSDPLGAIMAAGVGQKGDIGEGYDEWLAADDPDHRGNFDSGFHLANSLRQRGKPEAVVWMWIQGYAFGSGIKHSECQGEADDSWATGGFPPLRYMVKEACGMIAAGATGLIFFGFPGIQLDEAEIINTFLRAFSSAEVYGPALLSPRLDLGVDTLFMGEEGYDGEGRVHAIVKWDEATKTAFIIGANPGARETLAEFPFPWTIAGAERLDWETATFVASDAITLDDKTLRFTFPVDAGEIIRVHPYLAP
jgi:hypothetical protein